MGKPNKYGLDNIESFPFEIKFRGVNERSLRTMCQNRKLSVSKDWVNKVFLITKKKEDDKD